MAEGHPSKDRTTASDSRAAAADPYYPTDIDADIEDDECWTLQIKTVGEQEEDFSVTLHPEDEVAQLYDEIGGVTGLTREQQRLIYRGRLLASPNSPVRVEAASIPKGGLPSQRNQKIRDIVGLTDGHTIHLVRKQPRPEEEDPANEETNAAAGGGTVPSSSTSGGATASLLAALLGMGSGEDRRNRRAPYRLREEDLLRPDPGSMEPVRQGLLTLHTLLPTTTAQIPRQFYRGQWIDSRDTVNQWLEATVVEIMYPSELLPPLENDPSSSVTPAREPTTDSAVAVTDLDGRRRLLLEPCDEAESEEEVNGIYYRRRDHNHSVQLLHVHYNGWPVRWDEWVRSDSERIRPFRVRTRHTATQQASPTVQTSMQDAPSTHFTDTEDESADRRALLPELHQVVRAVEGLLESAAANSSTARQPRSTYNHHLPWQNPEGEVDEEDEPRTIPSRRARQRELEALAPLLDRLGRMLTDAAPHVTALAASIDKEETADDEDDDDDDSQLQTIAEHPSSLGGLLSLLSRDRRRNGQSVSSSAAGIDVSTSQASSTQASSTQASSTTGGIEQTAPVGQEEEEEEEEEEELAPVDPDLSDFTTGFVNTTRGDPRSGTRPSSSRGGSSDEVASLLGAYLAAASLGGLTSLGAGEGGEEGAEGLGRLLRDRGNGGIDIHIHAVVTAPGLEGGMGLAALTGGGNTFPTATPVNAATTPTTGGLGHLFASRDQQSPRRAGSRRFRSSVASVSQQSYEDDIFAELYSENPDPVNHNGPATPPSSAAVGSPRRESATDSDGSRASRSRSRSRSQSRRIVTTPGSGGSSTRTIGSQRRGGMLGRFFRRNADNNE